MGEKSIKKEDIVNFLKSKYKYIKEGWLDDLSDEIISEDIVSCINSCTSPTGDTVKERLKAIFRAFSLFPLSETKVLILGQDPYPDDDIDRVEHYGRRAHGLAFSFANSKGIIEPPDDSLLNIFKAIVEYKKNKKIHSDLYTWNTNLEKWAKDKKILLLNTVLTYAGKEQKTKHKNIWELFVQNIITNVLNGCSEKLAIFLWGKDAQQLFYTCVQKTKHSDFLKGLDSANSDNIKAKKLVKSEAGIELSEKVKIFLTNHPSFLSENNKKYGGKFIEYSQKHFAECDEFLFDKDKDNYIWLNFPENTKLQKQ